MPFCRAQIWSGPANGGAWAMAAAFRRAMDVLYLLCVVVGCVALVLISAIIPWAVFTRYVLNSAASWPEPLAVLLTIVLTFIGAAAAYRLNLHMNVSYFADQLPRRFRRLLDLVVQLLMALIAHLHDRLGRAAGRGDLAQYDREIFPSCRSASPICRFRSAAFACCFSSSSGFFLAPRPIRSRSTAKPRRSSDPRKGPTWISSFCWRPCWSAF